MTAVEPTSAAPAAAVDAIPMKVVPRTWWDRVEVGLERAGEYLNPILVKEARQALKSKQFVITFTLVLLFGWGWSLLGVATVGQDVFYAPSGPYMLIGYLWILAFPLVLIVPFASFRSLASEREDGTYELLSITTLWPRQIIGGKLGSSLLQMLVYLSALSPCIAFTYLLRGIDIISILLFVWYAFLASLLLSMVGLLVATISKAKHWQVVLSVLMILALAFVYYCLSYMAWGLLTFGESMYLDQPETWIAHGVVVTVLASFFVLLYLSAASRISFASDNRSTKLRIVMLAQQALITGWFMYYVLTYKVAAEYLLVGYFAVAAVYWTVTGSIMCGENPHLSQRVKRSLPQSLLARTVLTWFNPGPGTGFMFAVCSLLGVLILGVIAGLEVKAEINPTPYDPTQGGLWGAILTLFHALDPREVGFIGRIRGFLGALDTSDDWLWFGVLSFCYVVCYLGLGRLIVMLARRAARVGLFVSFLLQLVLVLLGSLAPLVVQWSILFENEYTVLQITSPVWTLIETADGDILSHTVQFLFWQIPVVPVVLMTAACGMLLLNLIVSSGEAVHERQAAPLRVLEDEKALHPERFERPTRLSPWDEKPSASPLAKS